MILHGLHLLLLILSFILFFQHCLSYSCSNEFDCSLGGQCINSTCVCNPEWKGEDCGILNLMPTTNYKAFYRATESSWGGSVVYSNNDSKYHMFVADMYYNCTLVEWQTNSRIVHAVSDTPQGPYKEASTNYITVPIWGTNPTVHQIPNQENLFVVYHIGFGTDHGTPINCSSNYTRANTNSNDKSLIKGNKHKNLF